MKFTPIEKHNPFSIKLRLTYVNPLYNKATNENGIGCLVNQALNDLTLISQMDNDIYSASQQDILMDDDKDWVFS